jgi:uncharacterized membrane protein YhaH (DUF805 family)
MHWYVDVLKKYAVFNGRARRQEYWMFVLFNIIAAIVFGIISALIKTPILIGLYWLAVILPSLGVVVRRLHDTNKSGWMILLGLIPFVGGIIVLVFLCIEGDRGPNRFGPDPKQPNGMYGNYGGTPDQGGYPPQGGYPGQGGYPPQSGYPGQGGYPPQSGYQSPPQY